MARILIGGGGIGGLTAALAIARSGHSVTLLERRPALAEFGAGVQVGPNASRILAKLGVLKALRAQATEPSAIRLRRGRDAAELARLPLADAVPRFGAPFLLVHRADLQGVLATAVKAVDAINIRFDANIATHAATRSGVALALSGAHEAQEGDGFVDARGVHALRDATTQAPQANLTAWRALVPVEAVAPAYRTAETSVWLGHRAHLVHYPIGIGSVVNVVAITPRDRPPTGSAEEPWSETGDPQRLLRQFRGWHRDALALLDGTRDWRCWPLFDAPPSARWGEGPCTRLGDAAHPMLPFLGQGASQAIEDASALAAALTETRDVATAFRRYEKRRAPRAARVQQASRRQGEIYHLGRPASDARDLVLRTLGGRRALARLDWLYMPA